MDYPSFLYRLVRHINWNILEGGKARWTKPENHLFVEDLVYAVQQCLNQAGLKLTVNK